MAKRLPPRDTEFIRDNANAHIQVVPEERSVVGLSTTADVDFVATPATPHGTCMTKTAEGLCHVKEISLILYVHGGHREPVVASLRGRNRSEAAVRSSCFLSWMAHGMSAADAKDLLFRVFSCGGGRGEGGGGGGDCPPKKILSMLTAGEAMMSPCATQCFLSHVVYVVVPFCSGAGSCGSVDCVWCSTLLFTHTHCILKSQETL